MRDLLSMLKPNHFFMTFGNSNFSNETVMKAIKRLSFVRGKIALTSKGNFRAKFSSLFDNLLHRKLEFLRCLSEFLARSNVTLKVGHHIATLPVNNPQLHKVLSHNPSSFSCVIDDNFIDETASLSSLSSNQFTSLK